MTRKRYTTKYPLAQRLIECQPSMMVVPVAMYQRPIPSTSENLMSAPRAIAQMRAVPKRVPATREVTMSPAPTPVAAITRPGPTIRRRPPKLDGASLATAGSLTLAISPSPRSPSNRRQIHKTPFEPPYPSRDQSYLASPLPLSLESPHNSVCYLGESDTYPFSSLRL